MSTKKELIREISELGITHDESRHVLESVLDEIKFRLEREESVQITNFGKFEVRTHEGGTMKNPKTGEEHDVGQYQVVHFSPSSNFVERFNEESD